MPKSLHRRESAIKLGPGGVAMELGCPLIEVWVKLVSSINIISIFKKRKRTA